MSKEKRKNDVQYPDGFYLDYKLFNVPPSTFYCIIFGSSNPEDRSHLFLTAMSQIYGMRYLKISPALILLPSITCPCICGCC